jgi:hypothetical protein
MMDKMTFLSWEMKMIFLLCKSVPQSIIDLQLSSNLDYESLLDIINLHLYVN